MTLRKAILAPACLKPGTLVAQAAKVTPLFSKDLTNLPGKEGLMVTVEYPPDSSDQIHRHRAVVVASIKTMLFTPSESHADAFGEHRR